MMDRLLDFHFSAMTICKVCGIEKLSNEFPPVTVSEECNHPPLTCLRVCLSMIMIKIIKHFTSLAHLR